MELISSVMHPWRWGPGHVLQKVTGLLTGWRFAFGPAGTNRIDRFQRVPSELRKYLEYMAQIKSEYGSVMRFVVRERLCWGDGIHPEDLRPRGGPFEFAGKQEPNSWYFYFLGATIYYSPRKNREWRLANAVYEGYDVYRGHPDSVQ